MPRHQFVNPVDPMAIGNFGDGVSQIGFRIEAVELRRLDERVDRRGALAAGVGTGEEVVLAPERDPVPAPSVCSPKRISISSDMTDGLVSNNPSDSGIIFSP